MISHRPCGACRALVPADTGCPHWKLRSRKDQASRQPSRAVLRAEARQRTAPTVADFKRMMGGDWA